MTDLSYLPRVWWFPAVAGLDRGGEDRGTYWAYPLDSQPVVSTQVSAGLAWLEQEPDASEWGLDTTDSSPVDSVRRLVPEELAALHLGSDVPVTLNVLAKRPYLQRRVRSFTACYLDLGDRAVPVEGGGRLIHFLSDQQWVRHWLVFLNGSDSGHVLSSTDPIGFDLADNWDHPPPPVIPLDGSVDL
jgi:hypothetical protein